MLLHFGHKTKILFYIGVACIFLMLLAATSNAQFKPFKNLNALSKTNGLGRYIDFKMSPILKNQINSLGISELQRGHLISGFEQIELGNYLAAKEIFQKIEIPRDDLASKLHLDYGLGVIDEYDGYYTEAQKKIESFQQKYELVSSIIDMGCLSLDQEKYDDAIAYFSKAIWKEEITDEESIAAYFGRGLAYFAKGNYDTAIKDFEKCKFKGAEVNYPNIFIGLSHANVAFQLLNNGNVGGAKERFHKVLNYMQCVKTKYPDKHRRYYGGPPIFCLGDDDDDDDDDDRPLIAAVYLTLGSAYTSLVLADGQSINIQTTYSERDKEYLTEAVKAYRASLEAEPIADAHTSLGALCYHFEGRTNPEKKKEAIEHFREAIKLSPDEPTSYYNAACYYALEGEPEKACDYLRKAIELDKTYAAYAKEDPDLRNLWSHSRFKKIVGNR